jgi:hypothetical protein
MGELVSPILAKPKLYGRGGLAHISKTKILWASGLAKMVLVFHEHEETFSS